MKTCYLHIGMHKTASTTLQSFLAANATELGQRGFLYPKLDSHNDTKRHYNLAFEFASGQRRDSRSKLQDEIQRAGQQNDIIISSETFSHFIGRDNVRDGLVEFFSKLGYCITVIVYIRPQISTINSLFAQQVTRLETKLGFDQYIQRFLCSPSSNIEAHYKPLSADKRFRTHFVPFNSALKASGICDDFLSRLNIKKETSGDFKSVTDLNISPGPKTIAAMLRIAMRLEALFINLPKESRSAASRILRDIAEKRGWNTDKFNGLTRAHKLAISEKFSAANDRFAKLAWSRPWQDFFTDDEHTAMKQPRSVFHPQIVSESEREDFFDFVRSGVAMIRTLGVNER